MSLGAANSSAHMRRRARDLSNAGVRPPGALGFGIRDPPGAFCHYDVAPLPPASLPPSRECLHPVPIAAAIATGNKHSLAGDQRADFVSHPGFAGPSHVSSTLLASASAAPEHAPSGPVPPPNPTASPPPTRPHPQRARPATLEYPEKRRLSAQCGGNTTAPAGYCRIRPIRYVRSWWPEVGLAGAAAIFFRMEGVAAPRR
jgi:hypothetical protein